MGWLSKIGRFIGLGKGESRESGDGLNSVDRSVWQARLTRSKEHMAGYFAVAKKLRDEYLGPVDAKADEESKAKGKPVNTVASFVNTIMPGLYPGAPSPIVRPRKPGEEFIEGAKRTEARLHDIWRRKHNRRAFGRAIFDSFWLAGFVISSWVPRGSSKVMISGEERGKKVESDVIAPLASGPGLVDEPLVSHIPYTLIRMDPDAKSVDDVRWLGFWDTRLVRELQADDVKNNPAGIYRDTDKLGSGGDVADGHGGQDAAGRDRLTKVFTGFEYGREPGELKLVALAGTQHVPIRTDYVRLGVEGFSVKCLELHDVGRLLSAAPGQFWWDQHDSLNEFVAEMTERARQSKTLVIVPENQPNLKKAVEDAPGGAVLSAADPSQVRNVDVGGVSSDTYRMVDWMERQCDRMSGVSDFQRGVEGGGSEASATEVMQRAQYAGSKLRHYQGFVSSFAEDISGDLLALLFEYQWQDVPVRVEDGPAKERFENFSSASVPGSAGDYEIEVDIAQPIRDNPALRQKRTQDTLHLLANPELQQMAAREGKGISVIAALRDHLDALGNRNIGQYVFDLPDPREQAAQQQQKAQQENQEMMASGQPAQVDPQGDEHQVHVQVHMQMAEMSPAIAEHMAEHYAYMEMASGMESPQMSAGQMQGDRTRQMSQGLQPPQREEAQVSSKAMQLT